MVIWTVWDGCFFVQFVMFAKIWSDWGWKNTLIFY